MTTLPHSPMPCPMCGVPLVQRVTDGRVWCAVYGTHDGALTAEDVPPPPPIHTNMLTYDGRTGRWATVTV